MPGESDDGKVQYNHTCHYFRLPYGCWRAWYSRDELAAALEVADAIAAHTASEEEP